jgi:hypothetical protein
MLCPMALKCLLSLALLFVTPMTHAQYITLQGDQFLDEQGEPFFPMIMSYYVDYYYPAGSPPDTVTPSAAQVQSLRYGRSSTLGNDGEYGYPANQGPESILQDLRELKAQGFNTLRFLSNVKTRSNGRMGLEVKEYPTGQHKLLLAIEPPYVPDINVNPTLWFHFNRMLDVCSLANSLGMKVLLEPFMNNAMLAGMPGDPELEEHLELLEVLAGFIHANQVTNILAYELFGEPTYGDQDVDPVHTKAEICQLAKSWNSALKSNDPNHLTTIGGVQFDDVFREGWDPLILDVDFASVHPYPDVSRYEWEADPTTFLDKAFDRYLSLVAWYDKYLTKPYIISETGIQCEEPFSHPSGASNPWISYQANAVYGNEQDQDDFIRAVLPVLKGGRCAGFGWWLMQNGHEDPEPPNGPLPPPPAKMTGRYYGLLRFGEPLQVPGTTGYEHLRKDAAETLVAWAIDPPPVATYEPPAQLDMSHRYYNPYMHPVNTGTVWIDFNDKEYYGTLTGRVVDQFGTPVPGAAVKGYSEVGMIEPQPGDFEVIIYGNFTFSDDAGYFELRAYDPLPNNPGGSDMSEVFDRSLLTLTIGAHESSWQLIGWDAIAQVWTAHQEYAEYELNSIQYRNELELDDIVVWDNETERYEALNSIIAHDVVVIGNVEMQARYSVDLKPGFHAIQGAEFHAYAKPLELDCADLTTVNLKAATGATSTTSVPPSVTHLKPLELDLDFHFERPSVHVSVHPNPSRLFQISLSGFVDERRAWTVLRVYDERGAVVLDHGFSGARYLVDMSGKAPGHYTIQLVQGSGYQSTHPVIVQ